VAGIVTRSRSTSFDGKFAYGLDSQGNVWGYAFDEKDQTLTSLGVLASGLPAGSQLFGIFGSDAVWIDNVSGQIGSRTTTIFQYPIEQEGKLGTATTVSLSGGGPEPFIPPDS
jgi:hypothetical protein